MASPSFVQFCIFPYLDIAKSIKNWYNRTRSWRLIRVLIMTNLCHQD